MSWRYLAWFVVTSFCLVTPIETWAQNYTFKKIVELSDGYDNIASRPGINNNGTVVFGAKKPGQQGIFVISSGGQVKPIALIGQPFAAFSPIGGIDVGSPDINDSDRVAYYALSGGDAGIFTSDGNSTTTIARTGALGVGTSQLDPGVSINNSGIVAFSTSRSFTASGVHVGNGGVVVTIDKTGINPSINNPGTVAYATSRTTKLESLVRTNTGLRIAVIDENDVPNTYPAINDFGTVAFHGRVSSTNKLGLFLGLGVPVNSKFTPSVLLVADGNRLITDPGLQGKLAINNNGTVVFWSSYAGELGGIFTGGDGTNAKVIAVDDSLLGGRVEVVDFSPHGLNDLDQIVFYAQVRKLVNGEPVNSRGIYIATPGELPPG